MVLAQIGVGGRGRVDGTVPAPTKVALSQFLRSYLHRTGDSAGSRSDARRGALCLLFQYDDVIPLVCRVACRTEQSRRRVVGYNTGWHP